MLSRQSCATICAEDSKVVQIYKRAMFDTLRVLLNSIYRRLFCDLTSAIGIKRKRDECTCFDFIGSLLVDFTIAILYKVLLIYKIIINIYSSYIHIPLIVLILHSANSVTKLCSTFSLSLLILKIRFNGYVLIYVCLSSILNLYEPTL